MNFEDALEASEGVKIDASVPFYIAIAHLMCSGRFPRDSQQIYFTLYDHVEGVVDGLREQRGLGCDAK